MSKINPHLHDQERIQHVFSNAIFLRISCLDEQNKPYIIPVNFGYQDGRLYFHSSPTGKKIDCLRKNNWVAFQADCHTELIIKQDPCKATVHYHSISGSGTVHFITDPQEKRLGMLSILNQDGVPNVDFNEDALVKTEVLRIDILECTYKQSPV